MAGISEKALYNPQNKRGFNGNELQNKEFSNGSGLELYDFNARTYDPQIGRFIQLDPLMELYQENWTPYHYAYNNTRFSDPDGKLPIIPVIFIVIGLVTAAAPAVAPSGQASDVPAIKDSYRNYHTDIAFALAPGVKSTKVSTSLFARTTTKEAVETATSIATKEAAQSAANKIREEVKDAISDAATPTAAAPTPTALDGSFSVTDWSKHPTAGNVPKPDGPFRILDGAEYGTARNAANKANQKIHRNDPSLKGRDIHEVHPVKFGGSPTDPANKVPLTRKQHSEYTNWWNNLQRSITGQ